jgi:predicted aspartyl protease
MSLRAKQIKQFLALCGASGAARFFEKEDLARALADAWLAKRDEAVRVPLRQIVGMPGNPRAGYVLITLDVGANGGLVDFLIDSGATAALVSPKLREMIGDECREGAAIRGLGSMGETVRQKITIDAVSVGSETLGPLDAVVTDLSAAGLPDVVGGLLGLDFLSRFECDFDFAEKTIRLHRRGAIACGALDVAGLVEVPLATHPTGLKTVRIRLNGCEPFPAVVDMGSFLSVVNWMAAARGGVAPDSPETRPSELTATGIDGRTMPMATAPFDLEVCGREEEEGAATKSSLTSDYRGRCCVGDLPAFAALGAETAPFASMGLDVLGRGRTVVVAGEDVVYLTPGGTPADGWEGEVGGEG